MKEKSDLQDPWSVEAAQVKAGSRDSVEKLQVPCNAVPPALPFTRASSVQMQLRRDGNLYEKNNCANY